MPRRYNVRVGRPRLDHVRTLTSGLSVVDGVATGVASVTHGIDINAANTGHRGTPSASGVPGGVYTLNQAFLDTYNGGSASWSGETFTGVEFHGAAAALAVTFTDCVFDGCVVQLIPNGVSNNGLITFNYCTLYGTQDPYNNSTDYSWSQYAFSNASHLAFTFCDIEGFGSGMLTMGDDVLVEDCYVHDPAPYQSEGNGGPVGGTHHGLITIQFNTCSDITLRRCHLKATRGTTGGFEWNGVSAMLTMYNDSTHPGPIDVIDCYFAGGGVIGSYWGALSGKSGDVAQGITSTGNIFGREYLRYSGDGSAASSGDFTLPSNTWSGNVWGALGVAPGGDPAQGATVGAPSPS